MLISILNNRIQESHQSIRQTARSIGISHTTLQRVLAGSSIDLTTLMKICRYLGVQPEIAINSMEEPICIDQDVFLFLQSEPELLKLLSGAVRHYRSNHINISDLKAIFEFAAFTMQKVGDYSNMD